jgi:uncharacterized membrane protein
VNWLLLWLHLLALATWLGETIFFGAVVAPALFGGLDPQQAGTVTALIFPGYYAVGYACGAVLLITAIWLWRRSQPAGTLWATVAVIAALLLAACLFAGLYLLPEADALRPLLHDAAAAASARPRFDALHRLSMQLNVVVLAGNVILAALLAARLSAGIAPQRRLSRYGSERIL